mgnify:FL=1
MRTVRRKNKDGSVVEYVQLAHNYRHPKTGTPRAQILWNFGRADQLDLAALRRLALGIARFLDEKDAECIREKVSGTLPFDYLGSRDAGGTWFLDQLWQRLNVDKTLKRLLKERNYRTPVERLLFALVANRALNPSSKLAMEPWVSEEVLIRDLPEVEVHQLYRAMDFLLEAAEEIQHDVFFEVANLFNLEVDLLLLDTTTTYFEIEGEDAELRRRGYSKDGRADLAQVVVGFAVTREGIPVRCWVWPGNTSDQEVIEEVKRDLNGWRLGRVVAVLDTGFNSEDNRKALQGAGGHYIMGEKLRVGSKAAATEALTRGGKYRRLECGLEIKEVVLGDGAARRRYVVVRNPKEVEKDRKRREDIIKEVERRLAALKQLAGEPHKKAACELRAHPVFGRYIRQTKAGKLQLNRGKIREEARFDGKFLVSCSDDTLSAEDIVLGYKQLAVIERCFRDLKHVVDIRPVYHRLPDRIKAHVLLCWLALLLIRVAENETGKTWREMCRILRTLDVGIHRIGSEEVWRTSKLTKEQKELFKALDIKPPPPYYYISAPRKDSV